LEHETDLAPGDLGVDADIGIKSEPVAQVAIEEQDGAAAEPVVAKPRHFACFDGLRAIAAVSVLLLHTAWVSGFTMRSSLGAYTSRLEIGVSVFFLISGFLLYRPFAVSHLSGRTPPNSRKFWERRLLRIVPAYWLALTVLTIVGAVSLGPGWQGVASHYLFLQIYFPSQVFNGITQAWSLCTEMSFYFFLPFYAAVVVFRRSSRTHQLVRELIGVAVLYVFSFGFRYWVFHLPIITVKNGKFVAICSPHCGTSPLLSSLLPDWLPSYLDLFALGMLLAVASAWMAEHGREPPWLRHRLMPWISWAAAAATFLLVSHVVSNHSILYFVTPTVNLERQALYGLFAFFLLLPAVFGPQDRTLVRRLLRSWPMASLGVISYGIYLWHLDLIGQVTNWTGWHKGAIPYWMLASAVFGVTVAIASASYFGLERPVLRVKGRISWWDRKPRTSPDASIAGQQDTVDTALAEERRPLAESGPHPLD